MRIYVEGLWGVGKSTLVESLVEKYPFMMKINEPDIGHRRGNVSLFERFTQKYRERDCILSRISVAERSLFSTMAYELARGYNNKLDLGDLYNDSIFVVLYCNPDRVIDIVKKHKIFTLNPRIGFYVKYQQVLCAMINDNVTSKVINIYSETDIRFSCEEILLKVEKELIL